LKSNLFNNIFLFYAFIFFNIFKKIVKLKKLYGIIILEDIYILKSSSGRSHRDFVSGTCVQHSNAI